jgi:hypothetical protein
MGEIINREKLLQFLSNVDQEILNMCSGEGKHRPGVLHFEQGKNSCPVMNRLEILKNTPTQKNLDTFLELAAQDFGAPTADFFRGMSQAIFTQENVKKVPFKKAFDVAIKDAFYDMFRTARIAMEPRQVERIETIALSVARTIQDEINEKVTKTVAFQLGALVAAQKQQEAAREAEPSEVAIDAFDENSGLDPNRENTGGTTVDRENDVDPQ